MHGLKRPSGSRGSAGAVRGRGRGGRRRGRRGTRGGSGGRRRGRAEVEAPETRPTARARASGHHLPRSQAQRVAALQEQCQERLRVSNNKPKKRHVFYSFLFKHCMHIIYNCMLVGSRVVFSICVFGRFIKHIHGLLTCCIENKLRTTCPGHFCLRD